MDRKEFRELENLLAEKMAEVDALQEIYRRETHRRFTREIKLCPDDWDREITNRPIWQRYGGD